MIMKSSCPPANAGMGTRRALTRYLRIMPQRGQVFRKLMEEAAAMGGGHLNVGWAVWSVSSFLDRAT